MSNRAERADPIPIRRARSRRTPRRGAKRTVMGAIALIPSYLRLLRGLLFDPRVSRLDKILVAGAIAYVVSPIDLIPDFIPFIGQVDDIYLVVMALQRLISRAGAEVLEEHWDGDPRELTPSALRHTFLAAAFFLPRRMRSRLRRLLTA